MPSIGGFEMLVIAIVAIVVVGPKDLPKLLRGFGQFTRQIRGMAREFQDSMDDLARESELEDLRKQIADVRKQNMLTDAKQTIEDAINPITGESIDLDEDTKKIAQSKETPPAYADASEPVEDEEQGGDAPILTAADAKKTSETAT